MEYNNLPKVAYFSMEYGLDTCMRTYAGGLGILAGDYIKGAKDYNFPIIPIGIKWKQGYTDQMIDENGKPYDTYHNYEYDFLEDTGVKVTVNIRKRDVVCKVWKVDKFGNVPLYLLDTDIPENEDKWITGQLYGWFKEERIAQEMVLGIGGIKALRALGMDVDVYHFNEGHAVFAALELIREKMERGLSFEDALNETRKQVVFTTHTPIIEGNESHTLDSLMYMGANNGLSLEQMVKLGGDPFNMTVASLRTSRISNAVAKLHEVTANKMWKHIEDKSNIIGITNAIHIPTWVDDNMIDAAKGNGDLWECHMKNKKELIDFVYERNGVKLDADVLLIGFSRRAAPYKRSNFIFSDVNVIEPLLKNKKLKMVYSGKAHPLDDTGKKIIENIVSISKKYPDSVVFLENYDMTIGKMLTRGSDVWLNNPRRPKEASGTSGMKAAMNGVLNLSTLDGWWPEACNHGVNGWQFGNGFESENEQELDKNDITALYEVLLNEVIPTYYNNRAKWVDMMKNSILSTMEYFSVKRMLQEYFEKMYIS
ncbi:starch phosphorylase [Caloramator quimbayensis]|uniref:glycogen phosphorylase n=1 Tax=Caloramator quimbayensis TaxID=1147123 RepID=A0A1T4XNI5_9CLOT|nr:alpha-glucan family phosphorylase [Caloramator quimbayensis]SKA90635.1 starch phosphorylase [Caloramator quimbayensis]